MSDTGWRTLAPSKLILVLLLGFLPWIRISCVMEDDSGEKKAMPMMSQTGYQIATGGATMDMAEAFGGVPEEQQEEQPDFGKPIFVQAFFALVGCAALVGFAFSFGGARTTLMALCIVFAMALLGTQKHFGFPIVQGLKKDAENGGGGPFAGMGGGGGGPEMTFLVQYQIAYYATWALTGAALLVTLAEPGMRKEPAPERGRSRSDDDDDEPSFELVDEDSD